MMLFMIKKFPQYLSSPLQVLWFEVDEVGIIFLSFLMGLMLEGFFYIGMIVFPYLYTKFKKKYPRGFLGHVFYFLGITKIHGYPHFFQKEFIE